MKTEIREGDIVRIKRHRCGIDTIGPFTSKVLEIEDGEILHVVDEQGCDWGVAIRNAEKAAGTAHRGA